MALPNGVLQEELDRIKSLLSPHEFRDVDHVRNAYRRKFCDNKNMPPGFSGHINRHLKYLVDARVAMRNEEGRKAAHKLCEVFRPVEDVSAGEGSSGVRAEDRPNTPPPPPPEEEARGGDEMKDLM